jgi:hypothetical protein
MHAWDRWLGGLWALAHFIALPLVAGLDFRFGWTGPVDTIWHVLGAAVFAAGLALFGWAMIVNAYFSRSARIQRDRGQTVCRDGPYRVVRHRLRRRSSGRSGAALLGSAWALCRLSPRSPSSRPGPGSRTDAPDRLPGYAEYALQVNKRLVRWSGGL